MTFFEGHSCDWFETLYKLKTVCNPVNGKSHSRVDYYTCFDAVNGGTSKGTQRELIDTALGIYEGKNGFGFVAVLTVAALKPKDSEAPSEQGANIKGSFFGFIDDFDTKKEAAINNKQLCSLTGSNVITRGRKYEHESTFTPIASFIFMANGIWHLENPPDGADDRRATGQRHNTFFVDAVGRELGVGEVVKDSNIKENIERDVPECFLLVCMYFYIDQACSGLDVMLPRPPSADDFRNRFLKKACDPQAMMQNFVSECLVAWDKTTHKDYPAATHIIDEALHHYSVENRDEMSKNAAAEIMRRAKFDGHPLVCQRYETPRGMRMPPKKLTVYKAGNKILTLKV